MQFRRRGHLFIASLPVAKIRRANVGPNEQGYVDAFNTQVLPLNRSGCPLSRSERDLETINIAGEELCPVAQSQRNRADPVPGYRRCEPRLRHFGKEGAPPVVCFQHFTGTMANFDPIHTNRLAQDRPVILVDYRGVGRSGGEMPDSIPATAAILIAFVKALGLKQIDLFAFSIGGMIAQRFVGDARTGAAHPPRGHWPFGRRRACGNFRAR